MTRPDRGVVYPRADTVDEPHVTLPTGSRSLAEVIALVHVALPGRASCRVALVFNGGECQRLSAILNGVAVYRESETPGYLIAPALVDRLVAWAETARQTRSRWRITDAAADVVADKRLANAIQRHGPRVVLRLLLYRAHLGRFTAPADTGESSRTLESAAQGPTYDETENGLGDDHGKITQDGSLSQLWVHFARLGLKPAQHFDPLGFGACSATVRSFAWRRYATSAPRP